MARIPLIETEQAPLAARPYYANGLPGPIARSLAHVPELLTATMPFLGAVFGDSAVAARLKEIVVLRASAVMQCRYCIRTHTAVALDAGLSRDEVVALRAAEPAEPSFSDARERALVRWTEALAGDRGAVPDELAAALSEHFAEHEVVELTLLAGATIMLNRYCTALDLPASADTMQKLEAAGLS